MCGREKIPLPLSWPPSISRPRGFSTQWNSKFQHQAEEISEQRSRTEILKMDHQQKQFLLNSDAEHLNSNGQLKSRLKDVLLVSSLLLNLLPLILWIFSICSFSRQAVHRDAGIVAVVSDNNLQVLTWSRHAAEEAEAAAAYRCSGHGHVFVDTVNIATDDGEKTFNCECNDCYTGPDCSQIIADCVADVDSGDPLFLEPFWIGNAEASATVVPGWYRMGYRIRDGSIALTSPELETQIRGMHALVGNAVTEGRYIVIGTGSMQLIYAAVYSLSPRHQDAQHPAQVVAAVPYYGAYRSQTQMFDSVDSIWEGDARTWAESSQSFNSSTRFVEIVASPNNPTAFIQEGVLEGQNVRTVYDHAYYWPHFTAITEPVNKDVMLFTLSKVTGHAGSRLGWAIVKDFDVYQKMAEYVVGNTIGVSHDTQLRATRLLKTVISGYQQKLKGGKANKSRNQTLLFHYAYDVMRGRWQRLEKIFSGSQRFSLQNLTSNYCSFFRTVTGPSPAYAWVKCEREEDEDCTAVMKSGGIIGRGGEEFGGEKRYVRLSLIKRHDNFALLERRLQAFLSYQNFTVASTTREAT